MPWCRISAPPKYDKERWIRFVGGSRRSRSAARSAAAFPFYPQNYRILDVRRNHRLLLTDETSHRKEAFSRLTAESGLVGFHPAGLGHAAVPGAVADGEFASNGGKTGETEREASKSSPRNGVAASSTQKESAASSGIPLAGLPLIGVYAGDDPAAQKELEKQLEEISSLLAYSQHNECWVDGVVIFRAMLAKSGMTVPETMTEADAAAEILKQTAAVFRHACAVAGGDRQRIGI